MINYRYAKEYCKEDFRLIENYEKAIADNTQTWAIHHRLETHFSDGTERSIDSQLSKLDLATQGLYYKRPAAELIFMTKKEHRQLHMKGKSYNKGNHSKNKGKKRTEEQRKRMSEAQKGRIFSEEHKKKLSEAAKRRRANDKAKRLFSEAHKGIHWYNNGVIETQAFECPDGFISGRLKK